MAESSRAPLVPNENPPAYSAPPGGYKQGGSYQDGGYPAGHSGGSQAGYSGGPPPGYSGGHPAGYGGGPPAGYSGGTPAGYGGPQPTYMQQPGMVIVQQPHPGPTVVVVGGCPACRVGVLQDDFTCLGVLCAILFFPLGLICCVLLRQRHCPNCGAVFG